MTMTESLKLIGLWMAGQCLGVVLVILVFVALAAVSRILDRVMR